MAHNDQTLHGKRCGEPSSPLSRACLSLARMLGLCAAAHASAPAGPADHHAEVDLESLPTVLPPRLLHLDATHFREVREYYGAVREARARLETLEQLRAVECTQMMLELQVLFFVPLLFSCCQKDILCGCICNATLSNVDLETV